MFLLLERGIWGLKAGGLPVPRVDARHEEAGRLYWRLR